MKVKDLRNTLNRSEGSLRKAQDVLRYCESMAQSNEISEHEALAAIASIIEKYFLQALDKHGCENDIY